jgi:hypothetical protein
MGGQQSNMSLANSQSVQNDINNVSNENCITACTTSISDININIKDSDIAGNVSVGAVCSILGSSCTLKASLSSSVQNDLANKQSATTVQETDPLSMLGSIFGGPSSSTNESSNQAVSNKVSNIMNSTCQNKSSTSTSGVNIQLDGDKVGGNVDLSATGVVSNAKCVIDNVARTTLSNKLTNSQTAKVMQGSPILFAIIGIVIIIVVVMIGIVIFGIGGLGVYEATKKTPGARPPGARPPGARPPGARPPGARPPPYSYRVR